MENESYYPEKRNSSGDLANEPNYNRQAGIAPLGQNAGDNKSLLGVFELLSISWKMFLERWTKFVLLTFLLIIIMVGLEFLFTLVVLPVIFSSVLNVQFSFIIIFSLFAIMAIIFSIPYLSTGIAIMEIIKDKNLGVIESINKSFGKLIPYIKVSVIGVLILIVFFTFYFILVILLTGGLSYFFSSIESSIILNIVNWLLGFAMLLVIFSAMLVIYIWIFFALLAVVLEGMRPMAALSYSYELAKGKMRSIVWKSVVAVALFLLIALGLFILLSATPDLARITVSVIFIFYFISIFTMLIFYYNIYENLKAVKINEIPEDFEAKNSRKIKLLAISGAVIAGLCLAALVFYSTQFKTMFRTPDPINILR